MPAAIAPAANGGSTALTAGVGGQGQDVDVVDMRGVALAGRAQLEASGAGTGRRNLRLDP